MTVRKRGARYEYQITRRWPAQRCEACASRRWVDEVEQAACQCGARLSEPVDERRHFVASGFRTKKEAQAAERDRAIELDRGDDPFAPGVTVREYLDRWMGHMQHRVRPSTHRRYEQVLRLWVVPVIGRLELGRVRPAHVQGVMDRMLSAGQAERSVVKARAVLGAALRQATAWGLIPANPVTAVRPPKPERPDLSVPTPAELVALLAAAEESGWEAPLLLAVATGARRGEVLAVRWSDLDLDTGRLRITGSLQRVNGALVRTDPKTPRARRLVALPGFAVDRLRAHRRAQAEMRLLMGEHWAASDLVCERLGRPIDPDAWSKAFKVIARRAGLPANTRLHDVRHAVATAWLEQGLHPAIASAALGHSSPAFTMGAYQHVLDGMGALAAEALEAALGFESLANVWQTGAAGDRPPGG